MNTKRGVFRGGGIRTGPNWLCACVLLLWGSSAWAIPSPDLVINLTASLAQVAGIASVLMGGLFVSRKKPARRGAQPQSNKVLFAGVVGVLAVSAILNIWQYARQADFRAQQLSANLYRKATENGLSLIHI